MSNQINSDEGQLEDAFLLFNQLSEKLADSYGDLESQVAQLSQELAEARNERLIQLAEKEVLAKQLAGLLDALPAGIVVLDDDDRITKTNPIAREMLGLPGIDKFRGEAWENIALSSLITEGDELRLRDGRWVSVSACPLGEDPGKIILISDITETRNMQNMLNRQERLSSLGEMIASLAHQVRTPLSSALLYISTLNHPMNNEKERIRYADKAKDRLRHLERMVSDMLIFAKGDVSKSEHINASEFVADIEKMIELDNRAERMFLVVNSNLRGVTIRANRDALLSAIQNIINNAIEACYQAPEIKITAFLNKVDQFEIHIKDNGRGMSEETREKVLEPFFTTRSSGTGLGLAVVNSTVSRYGGELSIHSEEGVGSSFNIVFPCAEITGMLPSQVADTKAHKNRGKAQVLADKENTKVKLTVINGHGVAL